MGAKGAKITICSLAGVMVGIVACNQIQKYKDEKQKYVVTAKADKKIVYTPIENAADLHVMEFRQSNTDMLLYDYINIGDTIDGDAARLSRPVIKSSEIVHGKSIDMYPLVIRHVNGKDLDAVERQVARNAENARRDSIIRAMQQKHR